MKKSLKNKIEKVIVAKVRQSEMKYVEALVKVLGKRKGPHKAIHNCDLQDFLYNKFGDEVASVSIRRYINYIRIKKLVTNLIACSDGYCVATTPEQLSAYIQSLQHRAYAIFCLADSYEV
jgi:hypothetical protein